MDLVKGGSYRTPLGLIGLRTAAAHPLPNFRAARADAPVAPVLTAALCNTTNVAVKFQCRKWDFAASIGENSQFYIFLLFDNSLVFLKKVKEEKKIYSWEKYNRYCRDTETQEELLDNWFDKDVSMLKAAFK